MEKKLKSQKLKRYALIAVWVLVAVGLIAGISLSGRDKDTGNGAETQVNETAAVSEETALQENEGEEPADTEETASESEETQEAIEEPAEEETAENQEKADTEESSEPEESTEPEEEAEEKTETIVQDDPDQETVTVSIQILCYTLSNDMSQLENEAIAKYIPANGVMLGETQYIATKGETVYDALSAVCKSYGIQLDANYKSSYGSGYVEGIGYLYEFDAGPKSGWMYSVNGSFPNYGSSSYTLSDGDQIKWLYTCEGIGADL